jgi:acetolactate synthase-1/2/3 large subunit
MRTGGRLLVDALRLHGIDRVFCVPGESYLDALDAFYDTPEIELVVAKHEGAASNMAEADGKLTGRPGVCFVTRGPGATHASVGVHTARHDSTPMILCIGQVPRRVRGREAFQEVDYRQLFQPIAKWVDEVDHADAIPAIMLRAFEVATSDRPGPVVLSFPEDVLEEASNAPDTRPFVASFASPSDGDVNALRAELERAERPLLIVGGSCWSAAGCDACARFARDNALPVLASFRRQDLIDNHDPHYVGHLSVGVPPHLRQRVRSADLIISLGSRLSEIPTLGYTLLTPPRPAMRLVHVYPDARELNRVYHADVAIAASPSATAERLASLRPIGAPVWRDWTRSARQEHEAYVEAPRAESPRGVDLSLVIKHVSANVPREATIASGAGNFAVWVHRFFTYKQRLTELAPTSGAMGYGLPAAIAAGLRNPGGVSICVAGDGDFLMYPQELATAKQYGARVIVLVVNNGSYATIRMHQERKFPGRVSGTALQGPEYQTLGRAFGAYAERVETTACFAAAFDRALASGRSAVLDLAVDPDQLTPDVRVKRAQGVA